MFHTILTLSYIVPNIYLFVRIWQFYTSKKHRLGYILTYVILFLVYPVSNILDERDAGPAVSILGAAANYLLPLFLYLFLFVLFTDLLLLLNSFLKIINPEKTRERSFRSRVFLLIVCLSVIVVIAGIINFNTIRTSEYKVSVSGMSTQISRLRIAFVSDFHLQEDTPARFVERFVKEMGRINPDLLLYGGDIVEGNREDENMARIVNLLKSIRTTYGIFGVPGNHEHYARQEKGSFFDKAGIQILADSSIVIGHSFILAGRNDSHNRTRKSADEFMRSIPDSLPVFLIDHRPTEIEQIGRTHADIQLSGHTHNGQLFPINLITRKIYKLGYGYRKFGNIHFFVSSGLRLWGPPVRTTGKSEIMVIDININAVK